MRADSHIIVAAVVSVCGAAKHYGDFLLMVIAGIINRFGHNLLIPLTHSIVTGLGSDLLIATFLTVKVFGGMAHTFMPTGIAGYSR